jgi:hypothetical protein
MFVFSMIAAAAAATQPLEPVAEADMRCVAALLYAVGSAEEKKDAKSSSLLIAAVAYYNGRLDARQPGINYTGHINRLAMSSEFEGQLDKEIRRCAMEAGTAMKTLGQAAQAVGK